MECEVCGFRREQWTDGDLRTTLTALPHLARHVLDGASRELQAELAALLAPVSEVDDVSGVHDGMHLLHLAGRLRHTGTATTTGEVVRTSRSGGGVPKLPVDRVAVTAGGIEGDRQQNRRHHGRPWQAVCLWSAEVVDGLRAEGHPIDYGSAGENLTVRGLDWGALSPGVQLLAGTALLQVTAYAIPCVKNAQWFSDRDFSRMAQEVRPGGSRLYASVLVPGQVATGEPVVVEPVQVPVQPRPGRQLPIPY